TPPTPEPTRSSACSPARSTSLCTSSLTKEQPENERNREQSHQHDTTGQRDRPLVDRARLARKLGNLILDRGQRAAQLVEGAVARRQRGGGDAIPAQLGARVAQRPLAIALRARKLLLARRPPLVELAQCLFLLHLPLARQLATGVERAARGF